VIYTLLSPFNPKTAGHPESYYRERYTTLDFRGGLFIDPTSIWGYGNIVITQSHPADSVGMGAFTSTVVDKPVHVEDHAWITSCCTLYNCRIGHHSIVSIGSVVVNVDVPPYTMVAGNPAKKVAVWSGNSWMKVQEDI
jgi:acetyltransferase-like isoleucine patch superfamily enzyme